MPAGNGPCQRRQSGMSAHAEAPAGVQRKLLVMELAGLGEVVGGDELRERLLGRTAGEEGDRAPPLATPALAVRPAQRGSDRPLESTRECPLEPLHGLAPPLVRARDPVAEIQQHLGDAAHADASDAYEVDLLVLLEHG